MCVCARVWAPCHARTRQGDGGGHLHFARLLEASRAGLDLDLALKHGRTAAALGLPRRTGSASPPAGDGCGGGWVTGPLAGGKTLGMKRSGGVFGQLGVMCRIDCE